MEKASIDTVLNLAKKVAATAKKVDLYHESDRQPPAALESELDVQERDLDSLVKRLLATEKNLRGSLLEHEKLTEESASELEWSYRRAACVLDAPDGRHGRLFFLPFLYVQDDKGKLHGVIDFVDNRRETLKQFLADFVARNFFPSGPEAVRPEVRMYPKAIVDWVVTEEEERHLPKLHEAVLEEEAVDLASMFKAHGELNSIPSEDAASTGWSVGVLAFSVLCADVDLLEAIDFSDMDLAEDFQEEFEEIFDQSSLHDYSAPVDPMWMANEGAKQLWLKQVDIGLEDLAKRKKRDQLALVETTFVWADGFLDAVLVDFIVQKSSGEGVYRRRVVRQALSHEEPSDVAAYLMGHEGLMRGDFKAVFGHAAADDLESEDDDEDD